MGNSIYIKFKVKVKAILKKTRILEQNTHKYFGSNEEGNSGDHIFDRYIIF